MERIRKINTGILIAIMLLIIISGCTQEAPKTSTSTTTTTLVGPSSAPSAPSAHDDGLDGALSDLKQLDG